MNDSLFADYFTGATFSDCRTWRYRLWRHWAEGPTFVVIGLNPSTADETQDDPTIRRCIGFAKREGCGRLEMLNLFGFRSPHPEDLYGVDDPVGPDNNDTIAQVCQTATTIVAAWGAEKIARPRASFVQSLLSHIGAPPVQCFGYTAGGSPRHPLYLRADTSLEVM